MRNKKNIRDFCIGAVRAMGIGTLYRGFCRIRGPLVRVLVFHDVQDALWFENTLDVVLKKYRVLSPEDFFREKFDPTRINVLITFDDGYTSWTETCLPILEKKNVRALFFVNSGLIDTCGDDLKQAQYVRERLLLNSPRTILSWDGVRMLHNAGQTIGSHSTTHARLSELHKSMQKVELEHDKARLEEMLSKEITAFAYPFGQNGDFTKETELLARTAGFTHAFTTEAGFVLVKNTYAIPRLCIEDSQTPESLINWIEGPYDVYAKLKSVCVR